MLQDYLRNVQDVFGSVSEIAVLPKRPRVAEPSSSSGMFFVPNGPSVSHVEESTKSKIRLGEFVELSKLTRVLGEGRSSGEAVLSIRNGLVEVTPRGKPVDKFEKFLDAFIVFMTIRGRYFPNEFPGMLKHFETVKKLCYQGKCGLQYDRQFRTLKADFPELSWSQFMPEFVSEPTGFVRQASAPRVFRQAVGRGSVDQKPCYQFNGPGGTNQNCRFRHVCRICGSNQHKMNFCKQSKR